MTVRNFFRLLFAALPAGALIAAIVPLVRSLFYDFHNDTVPVFSIAISVILTLLFVFMAGAALLAFIEMIRKGRGGRYADPLGALLLLDLGFAAVCYFFKDTELKKLIIFVSASAFSLLLSLIFSKIGRRTVEADNNIDNNNKKD